MEAQNEHFGRLLVTVTTALGALPLEGAQVLIYGTEGEAENQYVLYSLRTDATGQTPRVLLPTVAEGLSEVPGQLTPYTTYSVTVRKDGYYYAEENEVPIFEGVTSIQPMDLIPLAEYGSPDSATPEFPPRVQTTPKNGEL
ncbi:MAG: hypothetical protein J6D21_08205 [Clostridia bacterium]|nr:hypothetical protein [Clostridia bacterium]